MASTPPTERGLIKIKPIEIKIEEQEVVENSRGGLGFAVNFIRGIATRIQKISQVDLGGTPGTKDDTDIGLGDAKNAYTSVTVIGGLHGATRGSINSLPNSGISIFPSANQSGEGGTDIFLGTSVFRGQYDSTATRITDAKGQLVSGSGELTINGTQVNLVVGAGSDGGGGVGISTPVFTAMELQLGAPVKKKRRRLIFG